MIVDDGKAAITSIEGAGPPDKATLRYWQEPGIGDLHLIYAAEGASVWVWACTDSASIRVAVD